MKNLFILLIIFALTTVYSCNNIPSNQFKGKWKPTKFEIGDDGRSLDVFFNFTNDSCSLYFGGQIISSSKYTTTSPDKISCRIIYREGKFFDFNGTFKIINPQEINITGTGLITGETNEVPFIINLSKSENEIPIKEAKTESFSGNFTDTRDGKTYRTVKIGKQIWLAENFAFKPSNGKFWAYNNDTNNVSSYGYLYTLETAQSIVPKDWHIPSNVEWKELIQNCSTENRKVFDVLKVNGSSGFNAIKSGCSFADGVFNSAKPGDPYFLSVTSTNTNCCVYCFTLDFRFNTAQLTNTLGNRCGASIRLIHD